MPREVEAISPQNETYRQVLADYLISQDIATPDVQIEQILRADLEGDGRMEVLVYIKVWEGGGRL